MDYKVGDKVTIISSFENLSNEMRREFIVDMYCYIGKEAIIVKKTIDILNSKAFRLNIDDGMHFWYKEYFENNNEKIEEFDWKKKIKELSKEELFKLGLRRISKKVKVLNEK